jgi:endonuclease/exonuclease/phosphatase family metal-dependent hydrolase
MKIKFIIFFFLFLLKSICFGENDHPDSTSSNSNILNIATWNIQMLPTNFSFVSKLLQKKQKIRTPLIIDYCINRDFDIIVFQEVFDRKIRRKIIQGLSKSYPYQIHPIRNKKALVSNGVLIMGQVPLNYLDHIVFKPGVKADKHAAKGCVLFHAQVNDINIHFLGTHLQSGNSSKAISTRKLQYRDIRKLIDRNLEDNNPFIILGDLNTKKSEQEKYSEMLNILGVLDSESLFRNLHTFSPENSWNNNSRPFQLDYILLQNHDTKLKINWQKVLKPIHNHRGKAMDLADHYLLNAEILVRK